jgi:glycosyltransferase involved in cell wall biosynthesis
MQVAGDCHITLLICTYNNAAYLEKALTAIAGQVVDPSVAWEVLVVDNNCTDHTHQVVRAFQEAHSIPKLRLLSEPRQGVGFARKRGLRASQGRLIGFIDDDCLIAPDWLAHAVGFAASHPNAGAFGGHNELLWETEPNELLLAYGESLARQDFGGVEQRLPSTGKRYPVGAGLVLRREAVVASGWVEQGALAGRDPRRFGAGEDTELVLRIRNAGWEIWYTSRPRLQHVIPERRTTLPYLRRLHRGFGCAEVFLRNLSLNRQATISARCEGLCWSIAELLTVLRRFWLGYMCYVKERPTWLIRLSYACGCLEGAVLFLLTGGAR